MVFEQEYKLDVCLQDILNNTQINKTTLIHVKKVKMIRILKNKNKI